MHVSRLLKLSGPLAALLFLSLFSHSVYALTQTQAQKLIASDAASTDHFGWSVAISGDTAVIGAYLDDDSGTSSGSAYVYTRSGSGWTQQAKLTAERGTANDRFGFSVAISGDIAVIGAPLDDVAGSNTGSAYVFTRSGNNWDQQAKLTAGDAAEFDLFGYSVAISGDIAVIGALNDDDAGQDSGSAYVYTRSGNLWSEQAKLTASDAAPKDRFGYSLAISGDVAVIGAPLDDDAGADSGSAYVYTRSGGLWSEQAKLTAGDAASNDGFGLSVAISGDTAVIGAYFDDEAGEGSGSAYVYTRSGSLWSEQAKLTAGDAASEDRFGLSVAISGDIAVIGAHLDDDAGLNSGSAYVYTRSGSLWSEQAKLTAGDAANYDDFGQAVAISGDTVVVGAYGDDDGGINSGSAYVFNLITDTDEDGVLDEVDNCPAVFNHDQADFDDDATGDVCDDDLDGDGVLNTTPDLCPTSPLLALVDNSGCALDEGIASIVQLTVDLINHPSTGKEAKEKLEKALKKIDEAEAELADNDPKKALKKLSDVAKELEKAQKEGASTNGIVARLVELSRALAQQTIDDANASAGDPAQIEKAEEEMQKALDAIADGELTDAIDKYSKAVGHAIKAL